MVFVGPSGCGKSTLLRMVACLEDITEGDINLDGRLINEVDPSERDVAMVFQNYALYPHMNVYNNLAYGLKNRGIRILNPYHQLQIPKDNSLRMEIFINHMFELRY